MGFPSGGVRAACVRGPVQQPSLRQQRHRPRLQTRGQLHPQRAGGERGAERGVQAELRALAGDGSVLQSDRLGARPLSVTQGALEGLGAGWRWRCCPVR